MCSSDLVNRYDYRKGGHRHRRVSAARTRLWVVIPDHTSRFPELTEAIVATRDEWLDYGLRTAPADRSAAEAAAIEIHARCGCSPPQFEWVPSPASAIDTIATHHPSARVTDVFTSPSGLISELIAESTKRMNARLPPRSPTAGSSVDHRSDAILRSSGGNGKGCPARSYRRGDGVGIVADHPDRWCGTRLDHIPTRRRPFPRPVHRSHCVDGDRKSVV